MPWHELKLLKWKQDESKPIEKPKMSTSTTTTTMTTMTTDINNVEQQPTSTTSKTSKNVTKKKRRRNLLLGKLSDDLDYLEGLLTDVQLAEPFNEDESAENRNSNRGQSNKSVHLKRAAEDAISFLNNRQEFWSQFKPVYSKQ
jgi:hypothetical protein